MSIPVVLQALCARDLLVSPFNSLVALVERAQAGSGGMGELEQSLMGAGNELLRLSLERAAQAKSDATDSTRCPSCGAALERTSSGHARQVRTRFGVVEVRRSKGWCPNCSDWQFPADVVLGLDRHAKASPSVAEAEALLVSKMPASEAAKVLERLTGLPADDSTMSRDARREGEKAALHRRTMDNEACSVEGRWRVTESMRSQLPPTPFTLIIEMDAWMIRERDAWGRSEALRGGGQAVPSRWHWVYTATIFRLDQRAETQSKRPMIISRGFVATRGGLEEFSRQVYAEAVRQGLLAAADVLVIADGGVWIWNIAEDRFGQARQRLDFYHASEHLWAVAEALHGGRNEAARSWVEPLLHQLRHGGEAGVITTLGELAEAMQGAAGEVVRREAAYFVTHQNRMDYEKGSQAGEPIGSGAIESTCRQHQCRFKRPGQFWSIEGDESLLALETFWRNGRWEELFPYTNPNSHAFN